MTQQLEKAPAVAPLAPTTVPTVRELQTQGLHLQAYHLLRSQAPDGKIENIARAADLVLAGRIIQHCGAPLLAGRLVRKAFHLDRHDPEVQYFYARFILERRGPLACHRFQENRGDLDRADAPLRADWFALRAATFGHFRDFSQARFWIDKALALAPHDPWIHVEHASILEAQDRYPEALAAALHGLQLRPGYRPALQHAAQLHQLLGQDDAALDLLRNAARDTESMFVIMQLVGIEEDLQLYAQARQSLARLDLIAPLLEKPLQQWKKVREYHLAYHAGDFASALTLGESLEDPYVKNVLERLRTWLTQRPPSSPAAPPPPPDNDPPRRLRLPVGFIRQHHMTCVPATLSTLCRYWNLPADHLEITEKICYDGTPHDKERAWIEDAGHIAREFTLTWDAGVDLISRGVPFVLTTVAPESGHAQAVIGYDTIQRVFLVRDPYHRSSVEFRADPALEFLRSSGPRCLILLPRAEAHRLEGVTLPEENLYDQLYIVQSALDAHDRARAQNAHDQLEKIAPGHRLTLYSARCLAGYDANRAGVLAITEEILKQFPKDANTQLTKLHCLHDLARREDRLRLLRDMCRQKKTEPMFWQRLAEEIAYDARESGHAIRLLERRIRRSPRAAPAYHVLASALWTRQRFDEAFTLYRLAACMDEKNERLAASYFDAARHFRQTDTALDFLRERFARFGLKSSAPGRTLFHAFMRLNRIDEAFAVLEESLKLRPNDGDLLTFAAQACVRHQKVDRGAELLSQAKGISHHLAWLAAAAEIEQLAGRHTDALALWRQITQQDPLNMAAQNAIARILAQTQGHAAAIDHLADASAKCPHHVGLLQLQVAWERGQSFDRREATVRRLLALDAADAWPHRELADIYSEAGRDADALAAATQAELLDPTDDRTLNVVVFVHERGGRPDQARACARRALQLSVDNQFAMQALLRLCDSTEERRAELAFVQEQLLHQVIFGDSLIMFRHLASTVLEPPELLARLREAHNSRPDLWQSWSALVRQLAAMKEFKEAESLAAQTVKRMPLLPRAWVDLALVYSQMDHSEEMVNALQEALALSPGWEHASRLLATVYERQGDLPRARQILEASVMHEPLLAAAHANLAELLWTQGEKPAAFARLERALELDPDNENYWDRLRYWGAKLNQPKRAEEKLRDFTQKRGGEAGGWRRLARILPTSSDESLAAIQKAIQLEPLNPDNYDLYAGLLATAGKFDEAEKACAPAIFGAAIPRNLRARAAWVLARRGRRPDAIAAMQDLLKTDQSNYWAWNRLAEWLQQAGQNEEYLRVTLRMGELWPSDAGTLEFQAHARLKIGGFDHRLEAKKALRRVLEIDPARHFAAENLFTLQLEDKEWLLAEATLRLLRQQGREAFALTSHAQLLLARIDPSAPQLIPQNARQLFALPTATRHDLDQFLQAVGRTKFRDSVHAELATAARQDSCGPHVPAAAIALAASAKKWKHATQILTRRAPASESWNHAWHEFLRLAAATKQPSLAAKLIRAEHAPLHANSNLWGMVGYFYTECRRYREAAAWLADHHQRPDLAGWMTTNLVISMFMQNRLIEATGVCIHSLSIPNDPNHTSHLCWLALIDPTLLAGDKGHDLRTRFEQIAEETLHPFDRLLYPAARISLALAAARHARRKLTEPDIRPWWNRMTPNRITNQPALKRAYALTCTRLFKSAPISLKLPALNRWLSL